MSFRLIITEPAEHDRDGCFAYIWKRSPQGASRWIEAFDAAVQALLTEPHYGESPESGDHDEKIRQKMFKTRRGRTHRLIYVLRGDTIFILHVRGAGQDVMADEEMQLPDEVD